MADRQDGALIVQLAQWGAALDELVVKVKQAGGVKADDRQHLEELKLKFEELKAAGSEKWAGLADELELAWSELELAFKKLTN